MLCALRNLTFCKPPTGGAGSEMVVGFTIFGNFCLKSQFLLRLRNFHSASRVLSAAYRRQVMEKFAVRNVDGEERLQMCFNFNFDEKSRVFNLDRAKSEALNITLVRLAANVEKHFFKKKKKKGKKGAAVGETSNGEEGEKCLAEGEGPAVEVYLLKDGSKVPDTVTNETAWTEGAELFINGSKYAIKVNQPTIKTLSLPTCLMSDFPIYPKISAEFSTNFEIIWYRGKMKPDFDCTKPVMEHNIESWTEVSRGRQYTPANADIGSALRIECVPKSGDCEGFMKEAVGEKVVGAGPGLCPFENRHVFTMNNTADDCLRVVSYNILADIYADSDFSREHLFPLCPPYALHIDYRVQLLLKEIKGYNADVVCLQEVDRKVFDHELLPTLSQLGYDGYLKVKEGEVPEGSAIFYRTQKFRLVSSHDLNVTHAMRDEDYNQDVWDAVSACEKLKDRLLERKTCLQVALLESVTEPGRHVLVGTTHLYFHPNACHVRVLQGVVCVRHIQKLVNNFTQQGLDVAPIFCGDLNWTRQDGLMFYLINNQISKHDPAWMSSGEDEYCGGMDLSHSLNLNSACGFPEYTNYVVGFQGCLDYIFPDSVKLTVEQVVPMPTHEEVTLHGALPNIVFPSDHLALVCDLKWKQTS